MAKSSLGKRAIVIGAGIGGLTAAGALAGFFDTVTVLERDPLPAGPEHRAGTPQDLHLHVLLGGGLDALSELFPELGRDLVSAGAVAFRTGFDVRMERPGYDPFPQRDLGWTGYAMSRPLSEFVVRQRVMKCQNVTIRDGCRVTQLVPTPDGGTIAGIRLQNRSGIEEMLAADLFVDASARGVLTEKLLESLGQPMPEESRVGIDMGYSTALFAIPPDAPNDWKGVITFPSAPRTSQGAFLMPMEGNRWVVSLGAAHAEKMPANADEFLAFTRDLRTHTVFEAIRGATRLSEIYRFGFPASIWRHFERLEHFPRGLLVSGDAICRFNPVHGQGMSVAAQEACLLRRVLADCSPEPDALSLLAKRFFHDVAALIETPWASAAIPDFIYAKTAGHRPADFEKSLQFGAALAELAFRDPAVHKLMMEVQHLRKPRSVYRDPQLVQRVLQLRP